MTYNLLWMAPAAPACAAPSDQGLEVPATLADAERCDFVACDFTADGYRPA